MDIISKILQVLGAIFAFAGLVGNETLKEWEAKLQSIMNSAFYLDTENNVFDVVMFKGWDIIASVLEFLRSFIYSKIGLAILISLFGIYFFVQLQSTPQPTKLLQTLIVAIIIISIYIIATFVNDRVLLIVSLPLLTVFMFLMFISLFFLFLFGFILLYLFWFSALPYMILSYIKTKYNLKSTILLIGLICGLLGTLLGN